MVYKVDAKTGAKTLVRGVDIVDPAATLDKIIAAGRSVGVFNGYCGAESGMVPVSTVAPVLVFSEVELQAPRERVQNPRLTPPTHRRKPHDPRRIRPLRCWSRATTQRG